MEWLSTYDVVAFQSNSVEIGKLLIIGKVLNFGDFH